MPPGMTSLPVASTTRPASRGSVPGAPTATMRSPSIPTSQAPTPWGVTTCPPRITRSSMVVSGSSGVTEQEGFDALGLAEQQPETGHGQVDHLRELVRPAETLERLRSDKLEEDVGRTGRHADEMDGQHSLVLEEDHAEGGGRLVRHDRRLLHATALHGDREEVVRQELGRRGRLVEPGAEDRSERVGDAPGRGDERADPLRPIFGARLHETPTTAQL